jgi:plastocyanin
VALLAGVAVGVARAAGDEASGVVRVGGRPQRDVVVWLEGVAATPPPAEDPAVLDQRNLQFVPHVLAVPAGTRVRMPNSDRVFHNVFSFHDGKRFDLGLYPVGTTRAVTFDRPGLSRIFCNIHPNMAAYVLAVDSAYVAVTDRHGRFAIAGVPPGTYTWRAWRPGNHTATGTIAVEPGRPVGDRWP